MSEKIEKELKPEVKREVKKESLYILENKHNYPYELKIGRDYIRFEPRNKDGSQQLVEKRIVEHKDFVNAKKHFVIMEAK